MKYAFFLGCLIPAREPQYESSVRKIAPELGIELVEMEGANCCAPFSIQSMDYASWLSLAARNLCIAEQMGLNVLTLCNDCYESLLATNTLLKENRELRDGVNAVLADAGLEFKGKTDVKIFSDALYEDVGVERVKDTVKKPFSGLRVAVQPGCHLTKPKRMHFGQRTGITALDELVQATGAVSVPYERKEACCGGPLRGINDEVALSVAKRKLDSMKAAGVDAIVHEALNHPLLNVDYKGATGALVHITGGPNMSLKYVQDVAKALTEDLDCYSNVILGARVSPDFGGKCRVMAIMTGVQSPNILGPKSTPMLERTPMKPVITKSKVDIDFIR